MSNIKIQDLATQLGLDKHTRPDIFNNNDNSDETNKMVFSPDKHTHILIDYNKNRILFYNELSHLFYRYDIPKTKEDIVSLRKKLLAIIIALVEERNTFVRYEPGDNVLNIFK